MVGAPKPTEVKLEMKSRIVFPVLGSYGNVYTLYPTTASGSFYTQSLTGLPMNYRQSALIPNHHNHMVNPSIVRPWNLNSMGKEILETVGGRKTTLDGRKQFNPCFHEKVGLVSKDFAYYREYNPGTYFYAGYGFRANFAHSYGHCYKVADVIPPGFLSEDGIATPIDLRNMRAKAWYSMQPRFQGNVDMCLFLAELAEFKELVKYFHDLNPLKVVRNLLQAVKDVRGKSLKPHSFDPTRPAAEHHLIWNFGILPSISEIMSIVEQLKDIVDEAQQKFAENGCDFQTSHYTERYNESAVLPSTKYNPAQYNTCFVNGEEQYNAYTGTISYKYAYSLRSKFEAFKQYWGLNLSFSTIYNGAPFSFLLDYFITIGRSIRFMEQDMNVKLLDPLYGESFKEVHRKGTFALDTAELDPFYTPNQFTIIGTDTYDEIVGNPLVLGINGERYRREPIGMVTKTFGTIVPEWTHGTSRKQKANMAALARTVLF